MKIVDRLPYFIHRTEVAVGNERVRVKPYPIVVWVSLSAAGQSEWDSRAPVFPAILDPGNNHNFSIFRSQLLRWAGIAPDDLPMGGAVRERGNRVPLHAATIWLHSNQRGTREIRNKQPFPLILEEGIAVHPDEEGETPHLPLLGLRGLTDNRLQVVIDGANHHVTVGTARHWWWPFD